MDLIIIENDKLKVSLMPQGATLVSFFYKVTNTELVLGLNKNSDYIKETSQEMGKIIGRCANRIGGGKFVLDGIVFNLLKNNGENTIHSGEINFGNVLWNIDSKSKNKVVFSYFSRDMESGFPGNLLVHVTYEIKESELYIFFDGKSDKNTIMNMTNHSYFNFDKTKTNILSHNLQISGKYLCENDNNGMSTENVISVKGSKYDFSTRKKIGDVVAENNNNRVNGMDHAFLYDDVNEKKICTLDNNIISMDVYSNLPAAHFYTATYLDVDGRDGHYGKYAGIAIEPEFVPNAINYSKFVKPILKANEYKEYFIKYKINKYGI